MRNKQDVLGQYFTRREVVEKLLDFMFSYKKYDKETEILEPSFGTGNFIKALNKRGYQHIEGCEIDEKLTEHPSDFFNLSLDKKYDLIIGNPPFSKFNIKESYYFRGNYLKSPCPPSGYLTETELKKEKEKIENVFILKSLKHLKNTNSSVAFILPVSFFIKNRNKSVKNEILKYFSTMIIYQNDERWFDRHIPCCFTVWTTIKGLENRIILVFENEKPNKEVIDIESIHEELIPKIIFHKNNGYIKNEKGTPLKNFLDPKPVRFKMSYTENNVSAKNILERTKIPPSKKVGIYKLAVVRVGNASVGKCGLINIEKDVLNGMFYVFEFQNKFKEDKHIKELICSQVNNNLDYFRKITCRVGSKSIKKEDVFNFKVQLE